MNDNKHKRAAMNLAAASHCDSAIVRRQIYGDETPATDENTDETPVKKPAAKRPAAKKTAKKK
jgi:hypothetical protein